MDMGRADILLRLRFLTKISGMVVGGKSLSTKRQVFFSSLPAANTLHTSLVPHYCAERAISLFVKLLAGHGESLPSLSIIVQMATALGCVYHSSIK